MLPLPLSLIPESLQNMVLLAPSVDCLGSLSPDGFE